MKKTLSLLSVLALVVGIFSFMPSALAVAPTGTLTSAGATPLTVDIGQIVAVPDLTVTDAGGEITLGNDIRIQIDAGTNAIWDTTVLAPTMTPTGATLAVAAAVTYPDSKTLLIDVTASATAGDSLAISGLKVIGITGATAGAALTWAVDGATYGASVDPNAAIVVANGAEDTLTTVTAVPTSAVVGTLTTYAINFTIPATGVLPADGKITVTFPAGFTVASDAASGASGIDGGFAVAFVGQVVTITRNGAGTNATAGAKSITINKITNHATANSTYTVAVATTTTADAALANANSAAFLVNPAAIANLNCIGSSSPGSVYLTWTVPAGTTGGYEAKYSTNAINSDPTYAGAIDFAGAAAWANGTIGQSVGAQLVTGLSAGGTYFFNVKAKGAGTSKSAISNATTACVAGSAGTVSTTTSVSNPTSSITTPAGGYTSPAETPITITGVSSDNGVSSIQKVEISTDGGTTWTDTTALTANNDYGFSWTYLWSSPAEGPHTVRTRATNWIGVVETPGAGITITISPKGGLITAPVAQVPAAGTPAAAANAVQIQATITALRQQVLNLLLQLVAMLQTQLQALTQ
jgi:hypothetical protein